MLQLEIKVGIDSYFMCNIIFRVMDQIILCPLLWNHELSRKNTSHMHVYVTLEIKVGRWLISLPSSFILIMLALFLWQWDSLKRKSRSHAHSWHLQIPAVLAFSLHQSAAWSLPTSILSSSFEWSTRCFAKEQLRVLGGCFLGECWLDNTNKSNSNHTSLLYWNGSIIIICE